MPGYKKHNGNLQEIAVNLQFKRANNLLSLMKTFTYYILFSFHQLTLAGICYPSFNLLYLLSSSTY